MIEGKVLKFGYGDICVGVDQPRFQISFQQFKPPAKCGETLENKNIEFIGEKIIITLSFEDSSSFAFSWGSIFVLFACVCWGLENNCTRMLSSKNPAQIVIIKGFGSGIGSLLLSLIVGERFTEIGYIFLALILGFVAYGLSIYFYIYAQRDLGAAKTSTYYAISPFIGAILSLIIFSELLLIFFITHYNTSGCTKVCTLF